MTVPVAAGTDALAFDFCDAKQGLFGYARIELAPAAGRATAAAALFERDQAVASIDGDPLEIDSPPDWGGVTVAGLRIEDGGSRAAISLELAGGGFAIEVERVLESGFDAETEVARLAEAEQLVASTRVSGTVDRGGRRASVDCLGLATRTFSDRGPEGPGLQRTLGAVFEDGTLLSAWAARPPGSGGHGDEAVAALLAGPESETLVAEDPLISTHYDAEGGHVRAGLELMLGDDPDVPPRRVAGEAICRRSLSLGHSRLDLGFFRWSMAGNTGLGRYEILRSQ